MCTAICRKSARWCILARTQSLSRICCWVGEQTDRFRAQPEKIEGFGALERWDGKMGVGLVNAHFCMQRATELADTHGIGCVGLSNTNTGCVAVLRLTSRGSWIHRNMLDEYNPTHAAVGFCRKKIGNNPMAIAVPRKEGHVLLDMAMSQYSNGKLEVLQLQGNNYRYRVGMTPKEI